MKGKKKCRPDNCLSTSLLAFFGPCVQKTNNA